MSWRQAVVEVVAGQVVALDGKTLRRSYARRSAQAAIHLVSAWATQNRVVWGQRKTEEKAHELTALPEWRKGLDGQGGLVTIAARECQKASAQQSVEQGADYVLALKQNQGTLYEAVEQRFQTARTPASEETDLQYSETEEAQPGRGEIRRHWTTAALAGLEQQAAWAQRRCRGRVESERALHGHVTIEQR